SMSGSLDNQENQTLSLEEYSAASGSLDSASLSRFVMSQNWACEARESLFVDSRGSMQWGGRDSSRSLAVRNAEFAASLRQNGPARGHTKHRCPSRERQRTPVAARSISPRRPPEATRAQANPFTGQEEKFQSCLQRELDESMSELAIVQRRCQSLEESLTIAESQRVKARGTNTRLKERLQLFHEQNAENCRIAEMEIAKLTARLTSAETTIARLQDENNALDEAVRAQGNELKHLQAAEAGLEAERDEAFRSGQKLEESLRDLARDFETLSDQLEREKHEAQAAKTQLADLMEVSLSQAAKLEAATAELRRNDAMEIAKQLSRAFRCVANSVRRGSQARFFAVVLRTWRKAGPGLYDGLMRLGASLGETRQEPAGGSNFDVYVRAADQLVVMMRNVFGG
ncbi:hypothetical protein FOZ63_033182, partial [Perkinsus olseni]